MEPIFLEELIFRKYLWTSHFREVIV